MRRKYLFLFILFLFIGLKVFSQKDLVFSIEETVKLKNVDNFGNIYVLKNHIIQKYDYSGYLRETYADISKGIIADFDASNPMKIVVLHNTVNEVLLLDRNLNPLGDIHQLYDLGIEQPTILCSDLENGFCIYDDATGKFAIINIYGLAENQTTDIKQMIEKPFNPTKIALYNTLFYAYDPNYGFVSFDKTGTVIQTIPYPNKIVSINSQGIFLYENNYIWSLDLETLGKRELFKHETPISDFIYNHPFFVYTTPTTFNMEIVKTKK